MFKKVTAPDNIAAFSLTGTITNKDIDRYQELVHEKLKKHDRVGLCLDITELADVDPEAFMRGAKADIDFLRHIDQVGRLAVVSDKRWPHAVIGLFDRLLPGDAKVFTERERGLAWVGEVPEAAPTDVPPAVRLFATTKPDVLGLEINGTIGPKDLEPVMRAFEDFLAKHARVRLLNRVRHFGVSPSIFFQSGLLSMKLAAMQKVERYAIVGAPGWVEKAVGVMSPLFRDMDMRTFPTSDEAAAWDWLGAQPMA